MKIGLKYLNWKFLCLVLDGVVLVLREDLEHPADDSENLQGLHLGRGDILGLLNQPAEVDRGGENQQEHQAGVHSA